MNTKDLIGTYNIIGKNQEDTQLNYMGTLTLALDYNNRIVAKWLINNEQVQEGTGFFKDNILVINFNYLGENEEVFKGVVVYRCLTKDILEGFWSEEYGDPKFLGEERCFRVTNTEEMLD
jgi:hypothetical protein